MKRARTCLAAIGILRFISAAVVYAALLSGFVFAQQTEMSLSEKPSEKAALIHLNVIAQDSKTNAPIPGLKKEDFRVIEGGHDVPIESFDARGQSVTQPVVVWLVVLCNEGGKIGGSSQFAGKEALFQPALDRLGAEYKIGVAHWCDNGDVSVDLPPTNDRNRPLAVVADVIKSPLTSEPVQPAIWLVNRNFARLCD